MHQLLTKILITPAATLLIVTGVSGCGSREYEDQHQATLKHLRHETPFRSLWEKPVSDLPEKKLSLRIPKFFKDGEAYVLNPSWALTADPRRPDDIVDPNRVQPFYFELEGHQRTYEGFTQVPGRDNPNMTIYRPCYLYIAYVEKRGDKGEKSLSAAAMEKKLREELVKKFGKKDVTEWETVELPTPDGGTTTWKRLKATGEQAFFTYEDQNVAQWKADPGVYLLYLRSTPDYHVMLGWRCLPGAVDALDLNTVAAACAGTVKVGG